MNKKIDFAVGGQAVIEGVMMRSPNYITVSVRKKDGSIKAIKEKFTPLSKRYKALGIFFIRGIVNLVDMLGVGMKALNFSSNEFAADFEGETEEEPLGKLGFALTIMFSLALTIFLFKFIPYSLTVFLENQFQAVADNWIIFNITDGVLKTIIFIGYILLLSLSESFRRVFEYHGAEHKSIWAYEKSLELTPENAQAQTRFHPRCGTSFIFVIFLLSIIIYSLFPPVEGFWALFGIRMLLLPIILGVSYEFLMWSAKHQNSLFVRAITKPGVWFQHLTTREPDLKQLEVAINSLNLALELEKNHKNSNDQTEIT